MALQRGARESSREPGTPVWTPSALRQPAPRWEIPALEVSCAVQAR